MKAINTPTATVRNEIFPGRELKAESEPSFSIETEATLETKYGAERLDTRESDNKVSFEQNLKYWNEQVNVLSANNFNNSYFEHIVSMGRDAVPFILEEIKKKPSPLVHALDLIFPGTVEYKGYVSLKEACDTWISILQ